MIAHDIRYFCIGAIGICRIDTPFLPFFCFHEKAIHLATIEISGGGGFIVRPPTIDIFGVMIGFYALSSTWIVHAYRRNPVLHWNTVSTRIRAKVGVK